MKKLLYILLLSVLSLPMVAQMVYQCDFEDELERSQWVLNPGNRANRCENWWYMGKNGDYSEDGQYGLYVATQTNPDTLTYTTTASMMTVAYRTLTLEKGEYTLTFDWIGKFKNIGVEGVYVYWAPQAADIEVVSMPTTDLLNWQKQPTYSLNTAGQAIVPLYNQGVWDRGNLPLTIHEDTETRMLMFVFYSLKGVPTNPSFAIDNIEINKVVTCAEPTNIEHTLNSDGTLTVSWRGGAGVAAYEVRLCDLQSGKWYNAVVYNNPSSWNAKLQTVFSGLEEGAQIVQIRALCDVDDQQVHSNWVSYRFFYFIRGARCVDYMQLDKTTCSWQTNYNLDADENPIVPRNLTTRGAVDNGYWDYENTLHTLHYMPNEYDPYTMNHLATKPEGALASVRIGRYAPTHMSRVRYNYLIPEDEDKILVLRYALVLPNPHPDHVTYNPIFVMETLVDGQPLEGGCGDANFTSGYGEAVDWDNAKNYGGQDVFFKDWTTVSLNMKEYAGKTVTVTFTTTGCSLSAHGGYGYITLSCESGEMSGLNCGEENPTTDFIAPVGFGYRWWKDDREQVLSTQRTFTISPMDTATYHVDLIALGNEQCYHTLDACGIPRLPHIEAGMRKHDVVQCQNQVTFYNNSYILYKAYHKEWDINTQDSIVVVDRTFTRGEPLHNVVWNFGDGTSREMNTDSVLTHIYPKEGGQFTAWMIGTLRGANGDCVDSIPIEVNVPPVGYADVEIHAGRGYQFVYEDGTRGNTYWSVGNDTIEEKIGECERTTYLYIHETQFTVDTSFCQGGYFQLGDRQITESGTYKASLKSQQWPNVDSIVTLNLEVEPTLQIALADTLSVCGDQSAIVFPIEVVQGTMDSVVVLFDSDATLAGFDAVYGFDRDEDVRIDLPDSVKPGYYPATLQLGTPRCPTPDVPVVIAISYPSAIIAQKDGIIALLNENYNGGYEFDGYQWYRNGKLIQGANESYLVVSEEDLGAQYAVVLTRSGDGVKVAACPIIYNGGMTGLEDVTVTNEGEWMLLDVMGRVVMQSVRANHPLTASPGVYILYSPTTRQAVKIVIQ